MKSEGGLYTVCILYKVCIRQRASDEANAALKCEAKARLNLARLAVALKQKG